MLTSVTLNTVFIKLTYKEDNSANKINMEVHKCAKQKIKIHVAATL
jgi:hypothetical protein